MVDSVKRLLEALFNSDDDKVNLSTQIIDIDAEFLIEKLVQEGITGQLKTVEVATPADYDGVIEQPESIVVLDRKKLTGYVHKLFESDIIDCYGADKQDEILKTIILEKARRLGNNAFSLTPNDIPVEHSKHIKIFEAIRSLSEENFIKVSSQKIYFEHPTYTSFKHFDVRILLPAKVMNAISGLSEGPKNRCVHQFHFSDGILHRDHEEKILKVERRDAELQNRLLSVAFSLPIGTPIDEDSNGIEMSPKQLTDAARNLNKKIKEGFGIEQFFSTSADTVKRTCE